MSQLKIKNTDVVKDALKDNDFDMDATIEYLMNMQAMGQGI